MPPSNPTNTRREPGRDNDLRDAIWNAIKKWDLALNDGSELGHLYAGSTGTDVETILAAILPVLVSPTTTAEQVERGAKALLTFHAAEGFSWQKARNLAQAVLSAAYPQEEE